MTRGEFEATDRNKVYLGLGALCSEQLGRGCAWLDAGTPGSLLQTALFVQTVQESQGLQVGCREKIAFHKGFIGAGRLGGRAAALGKTAYGAYLRELAEGRHT